MEESNNMKSKLKRRNIERKIDRDILRAHLPLVVLNEMKMNPLHGYEMILRLRKKYGVYLGPSTIYPMLSAMEEVGFAKSSWNMDHDRPRKVYNITSDGETAFETAFPYSLKLLGLVAKDYIDRNGLKKLPLGPDLQNLETPEKHK